MALADMPRLGAMLLDRTGEVRVELEFGTDAHGVRFIAGRVETKLVLECQRCLEPMELPLGLDFRLGVVGGQQEAERLPEGCEPLVVEDGAAGRRVSLAALVEDELLLALPIVPRHEDTASCTQYRAEDSPRTQEPRDNPFAALAKLKHSS